MVGASQPVDSESVSSEITEDALLGGRLRLRQPADGFRAAIDPIFLAAAVPARSGERVLDLGCGVGTAGLALLKRVADLHVTGLELDQDMVGLARENAALNGVSERFEAIQGDVLTSRFEDYDHVLCNPPFVAAGAGRRSGHTGRDRAKQESRADLDDWLQAALAALRPKGSLSFVHRADRIDTLLAGIAGAAGAVEIYPFWPGSGQPAKRVILRARKGLRSPARLLPGLVLHEAGGAFTPEADAVLRDAAALPI